MKTVWIRTSVSSIPWNLPNELKSNSKFNYQKFAETFGWSHSSNPCYLNRYLTKCRLHYKDNMTFTMASPKQFRELGNVVNPKMTYKWISCQTTSSSGYKNTITSFHVSRRYLKAFPVTSLFALAVTKFKMDVLCNHSYLPPTLIYKKGTTIVQPANFEIAAELRIQLNHATFKHEQTIGILEPTDASVKTHLQKFYQLKWIRKRSAVLTFCST